MTAYAHPEVLVDTAWVAEHARGPNVRAVEVDVDTTAYEQGHIPGAIAWNWTTQLCDTSRVCADTGTPSRGCSTSLKSSASWRATACSWDRFDRCAKHEAELQRRSHLAAAQPLADKTGGADAEGLDR